MNRAACPRIARADNESGIRAGGAERRACRHVYAAARAEPEGGAAHLTVTLIAM